jgi:hypothetical protein
VDTLGQCILTGCYATKACSEVSSKSTKTVQSVASSKGGIASCRGWEDDDDDFMSSNERRPNPRVKVLDYRRVRV